VRLANRYLGSTTAAGRDALYFDQLERRRNVGLYSDLYEMNRQTGRVRALTSGARLVEPDLSPDGSTIACVQVRADRRDLVLVRLTAFAEGSAFKKPDTTDEKVTADGSVTVLVSEADTHFNAPRWSPDGRQLAVERHRLGSPPDIVIVDAATKAVRVVASDAQARIAGAAIEDDARDHALAVADDLRITLTLQMKGVPQAHKINQREFEGIERDGHRTPSARSLPLLIGSLVGVWLMKTLAPKRCGIEFLNRSVPAPRT
jgi:dipeptidyl aminopeptidase/acylaminoacyl peptidase